MFALQEEEEEEYYGIVVVSSPSSFPYFYFLHGDKNIILPFLYFDFFFLVLGPSSILDEDESATLLRLLLHFSVGF